MKALSNLIVIKDNSISKEFFKEEIEPMLLNELIKKFHISDHIKEEIIYSTIDLFKDYNTKEPLSFRDGKVLKMRGDVAFMM